MMPPIIIFYHCLFRLNSIPLPSARPIVTEQMALLKSSGLENAATEIHIGVNGDKEIDGNVVDLFPAKAKITFHGSQCRNENRTLLMIEDWCKSNEGEASILSFHSKGASHAPDSGYQKHTATPWRQRMMAHCIRDWRRCVLDLRTYEAVGAHWLTGQGWDFSQHYFAGNFFWVRASFFRTTPSLTNRQRIKDSGLDSIESRYEAEVHLGNGPRLPMVKNYYAGGIGT
jgi:hypothetical protein